MLSLGRTAAQVRQLSSAVSKSLLQSPLKHRDQLLARAMATQKAVRVSELGGQEQLKPVNDAPIPEPEPGHVIVKNEFAGVNYIDVYYRTGLYPKDLPYTPGVDGSGVVHKVGDGVTNFAPGDKVAYYTGSGSYAQYTSVPAKHVTKVPDGIGLDIAAAAMVQGMTAVSLATRAHKVERGQWVLVHAAAGGTGQLIVQVAAAAGGRVIGTVSTPEKAELAKSLGAEHVILYSQQEVVTEVERITGGKGVSAVFDGVGASTFQTSLKVLDYLGSLVSFGNASGKVPAVELSSLTPRNIRLMRPSLFAFTSASPTAFQELADETFALIQSGKLKLRIHAVYPLEEAHKAHADLEGRQTVGKVLLKP